MRIDFHSHFYAREYIEVMRRLGRKDFERMQVQDPDLSGRVAEQDAVDVDAQVLSFLGPRTIVDDATGAVDAAQTLNDIYTDIALRYPGRFFTFAMLPLPHVEQAIAEAERALATPTCIGVGLPTSISGQPLDDPAFEDLWSVLNARAATVYVHPAGQDSEGHWGMKDFGMGPMFGSPMQLGLAACRIVFSGLKSRHPRIRFVFAQGGGFLASRWEAIENTALRPGFAGHAPHMLGWVKDLDIDRNDPMSGFDGFLYDTAGVYQVPSMLTAARSSYGIDRLLLGSDTAFGSLTRAVEFLRSTDLLSDEERGGVLDGWGADLGVPA